MTYGYDGYLCATPCGIWIYFSKRGEEFESSYELQNPVTNDNAFESDMQTWFFTGFKHVCNNNNKASKLVSKAKGLFA